MVRPDADGSAREREQAPARRRTRAALAVLAGLACWAAARPARAHEPFEITADARTGATETTLRLLIAGRTAGLLCGALPPGPDAGAWRRCGGALFTLIGADGRQLPVRHVDAGVTVEADVAVAVTYAAAPPGALRFEATFLQRLADPTYGATLTITGPGVFLGQSLLRASAPSVVALVPAPRSGTAQAAGPGGRRWSLGAASVAALAAAAALSTAVLSALARRAARRPTG